MKEFKNSLQMPTHAVPFSPMQWYTYVHWYSGDFKGGPGGYRLRLRDTDDVIRQLSSN